MTDLTQTPEWAEAVERETQRRLANHTGMMHVSIYDATKTAVEEQWGVALPAFRKLITKENVAKLREWGDLNAPHGHRAEARMVVHEAADFLEGK